MGEKDIATNRGLKEMTFENQNEKINRKSNVKNNNLSSKTFSGTYVNFSSRRYKLIVSTTVTNDHFFFLLSFSLTRLTKGQSFFSLPSLIIPRHHRVFSFPDQTRGQ